MEILAVVGKSLGLSFIICAVMLFFALAGSLFWVRATVRDKAYCFFLSVNKQLKGRLLKPEGNTVVVGSGADEKKYFIHPSKLFWSAWPPGFPRFVQEPVPTLIFVEDNSEPLDPYDRTSLISPESLRKISDDAMLKQMWKDVRDTMGLKPIFGGNTLLLILVAVAAAASGVAAYMSYQSVDQIGEILRLLGG